jgi:uncharacterized membrane protein
MVEGVGMKIIWILIFAIAITISIWCSPARLLWDGVHGFMEAYEIGNFK